MNNSALDEHIKNQLGNYKPDVPSHIWENIAAEKDRRKPAGIWFSLNKKVLFLLLGIILLGGGLIVYKNIQSTAGKNETADTDSRKPATKTTDNIATENDPAKNTAPLDNVKADDKKMQSGNIPPTTGPQKQNTNMNDPVDRNNTTPATGNKNTGSSRKNTFSNTNDSGNDLPGNLVAGSGKTKKHLNGKTKAIITNAIAETDEHGAETNVTTTNLAQTDNDLLLNRTLLGLELLRTGNSIASIKKPVIPYLNIPCPESEKNAAGNKRYFEIYGGPDYAFRSITDTGNSAYLQKRKESSHFSSAFSVGVRYTKVFNNGMSFRTGINYSQINEKFKYAEGNIIQVVYIVDGNGDTTGSYTTSGTRYKTTFNKFRTIDVPLLIGYELGNGRWHANFNAGAIVNVYSWQKGDVLDTAYKPITITTGKASSAYQFKTNVGIGFLGSVSVYYKLTSRLHILAEPYFRYNFTPASKADLTIKQKYNTAGLRVGVRIDF